MRAGPFERAHLLLTIRRIDNKINFTNAFISVIIDKLRPCRGRPSIAATVVRVVFSCFIYIFTETRPRVMKYSGKFTIDTSLVCIKSVRPCLSHSLSRPASARWMDSVTHSQSRGIYKIKQIDSRSIGPSAPGVTKFVCFAETATDVANIRDCSSRAFHIQR